MRDLFYKGMRRLRSRGIKRQTLVRRILHQTRGQGIFFDYFFDFLLTAGERKPKFTTEICYGVEQVCFLLIHYGSGDQYFLTFEGMFSVIVWVTHAGSDWPRV